MNISTDEKGNKIYGNAELVNNKIEFKGQNNILYLEDDTKLQDSIISFNGDNSIVYIRGGRDMVKVNVVVNYDCIVAIGRGNYFNGRLNIIASEQTSVLIGDNCLISFGIWIRTADPHLIYDADSHRRINPSKNIIIGDHVWIGQNALILKGSYIGSGSIIGGASVISGKKVSSNVSYAGNPARLIREEIFWEGSCVHGWREKETFQHQKYKGDEWLYGIDDDSKTMEDIENLLCKKKSVQKRLENLLLLYGEAKNRFAVERICNNRKGWVSKLFS